MENNGLKKLSINEEEVLSSNFNNNKTFDEFISCLQDIVIEEEFSNLRNTFFDKYYNEFDEFKEENNLEHYNIFKKYVSTIETYLSENLKKRLNNTDLESIFNDLDNYKNDVDEELLELLLSFNDFNIFKNIIIDYKLSKQGKFNDFNISITKLN